MTATVIDIRSRLSTTAPTPREQSEGRIVDHGGLTVTHVGYDSNDGWNIELARPGQLTDGQPAPTAADLPVEAREALLTFLGFRPIGRVI